MNNILYWDKPEQIMPKEKWLSISADSTPPGVWTPNMSEEDQLRWKAKLVGHTVGHPRVEIRRRCGGALLVVVVHLTKVVMSANGKLRFRNEEWAELKQVVDEARAVLKKHEQSDQDPTE